MKLRSLFPDFPETSPRHGHTVSTRGMALVVTLIFVLLLTVMVIAFFSRVLTSRKVSSSSASSIEVSLFADGALDTTLADLKQEIEDGSTVTTPATDKTVYLPKSSQKMVPERIGTADSLPNLVKRSVSGSALYTGGYSRASSISSLTASVNGRKMTPARWNKPLLLPRDSANATSETNFTPSGANAGANTWSFAPDWIYVSRSGANPTSWSSSLRDASPTNDGFVVGRYAYAIYDEGGLLDANAAGYPSGTPTDSTLAKLPAYKSNLAFADLKQLPGIKDLSTTSLRDRVVDALVKVRNYTSWDTAPATFAANYFQFASRSPKGFLTAGNTGLLNQRSDLLFSSRQDLIQFLLQGLPEAGSFSETEKTELRQKLPSTLEYLSHFTRSFEQPSFAPDPARPKVMAGNGGNNALNNDDFINPAFLQTRVTKDFVRNDGISDAEVGEPLVKTRFALDRLAWLTHRGPIADKWTDADLQGVIARLKELGFTEAFLKRGTAANIQKYFGLSWDDTNKLWKYNVHNGGTGAIKRLSAVQAETPGREPDFVELLKATVHVGSIAKGAGYYTTFDTGISADAPVNFQFLKEDTVADYAILQIAANMIDQADLDGFPVRIRFNLGGSEPEKEFRGVENLPYFYRSRLSVVQNRQPNPFFAFWVHNTLLDPGVLVQMVTPEIWNPHDANSAPCAKDSAGNLVTGASGPLVPTEFRLIANSIDPHNYGSERQVCGRVAEWGVLFDDSLVTSARGDRLTGTILTSGNSTPPEVTPYVTPFRDYHIKYLRWTADTTGLEFEIPAGSRSLFREPTALLQPNVPSGTNLRASNTNYLRDTGNAEVDGRLDGVAVNGAVTQAGSGERYLGIYLGTFPAQAYVDKGGGEKSCVTAVFAVSGWSPYLHVTYRMQSKGPSGLWETYDEKYLTTIWDETLRNSDGKVWANNAAGSLGDHYAPLGDDRASVAWDPRTARFGSPRQVKAKGAFSPATGFVGAATDNTLTTVRPDQTAGNVSGDDSTKWGPEGFPNVPGWTPNGRGNSWYFGSISENKATSQTRYTDPDGTLRTATGAFSAGVTGLPLATGNSASRPIVLNRPFRSVVELGHVFSGTPWKNVSFLLPESGYSGLLDVFCINEPLADSLTAGKVNLNTRQAPVVKAILTGAFKDDLAAGSSQLTDAQADAIATELLAYSKKNPLMNLGELAGRWDGGSSDYIGFSEKLSNVLTGSDAQIERLREAPIRALGAGGQTRVWNLMIDMVAQVGRFPQSASGMENFVVEAERRYWVHLAVDRLTGEVIDRQIEVVTE